MSYQRPDLDLIDLLRIGAAFLDPDRPWGRITELSGFYNTSRQTLYVIGRKVQTAVESVLEPHRVGPRPPNPVIRVDPNRIDRALLTPAYAGATPRFVALRRVWRRCMMCIGRSATLPPCAGVPRRTPAPAKAGGWNYGGITQNALDEIFRARLPHLVSVHPSSGLILPRRTPGSVPSPAGCGAADPADGKPGIWRDRRRICPARQTGKGQAE